MILQVYDSLYNSCNSKTQFSNKYVFISHISYEHTQYMQNTTMCYYRQWEKLYTRKNVTVRSTVAFDILLE